MSATQLSRAVLFCLCALLCIFAFAKLTFPDVEFWDEATNLVVAEESKANNPWWDLRFAGDYFWEKPPLYYWLLTAYAKLFNTSIEGLVFMGRALSGMAALALVALSAVYFRSRRALIVFIILLLATPNLWFANPAGSFATHNFRSVDSDAWQLVFMFASYISAHKVLDHFSSQTKLSRRSLYLNAVLAAGAAGLAVMIKGTFGLLPLCLLNLEVLWQGRKNLSEVARVFGVQFATLAALIAPWHVYMLAKFGRAFWESYFLYHQFGRASSALEGHQQPFFFYVEFLLDPRKSGVLLVLGVLLLLLARTSFKLSKIINRELAMGLTILLILSLLGTKISWYSHYAVMFVLLGIARLSLQLSKRELLVLLFVPAVSLALNFVTILRLQPGYLLKLTDYEAVTYHSERRPHRVFRAHELRGELAVPNERDGSQPILIDLHESNRDAEPGYELIKLSDNYALLSPAKN